jgi:hypothetical protein
VSKTESEEHNLKKNRSSGAPQSLLLHDKNKKNRASAAPQSLLPHDNIKKVGPLRPASSTRFQHIPNATPPVFVSITLTFQPARHRLVQNV